MIFYRTHSDCLTSKLFFYSPYLDDVSYYDTCICIDEFLYRLYVKKQH